MLLTQNKLKISAQILTILFTMSVLTACGDTAYRDLKQQIQQIKARNPGQIPPLPSFKVIPTYDYSAEALRSPFVPALPRQGSMLSANRFKEPLEAFPLDALRMVGILMETNKHWAIIKAPNNRLYYAARGNYIGQNSGRIIKVDADKIELIETIQGNKGWIKRPASLMLAEACQQGKCLP